MLQFTRRLAVFAIATSHQFSPVNAMESARPDTEMQIYVRMPDRTITLDVFPSTTVEEIMEKVHAKEGIPPCFQKLTFNTKTLEDSRSLKDHDIKKESTLELLLKFLEF